MPTPKTYTTWTEAEYAHVARRFREGALMPTIARELQRPTTSVRWAIGKLRREGVIPHARDVRASIIGNRDIPTITAPGAPVAERPSSLPPVAGEPEWAEDDETFLARVLERTGREVERAHAERYVRLVIEADRPVALSLSSDWHLTTSGATDVAGLLQYADAIAETDGCYALCVGDLLDNPIKHRPSKVADIPDDIRLLDLVVGRFRGKLLGTTSGNHDDWAKDFAGADHLAAMARQHRVHYAPDELIYLVEIVRPGTEDVTARYVFATRHQYVYNSGINPLHAVDRWLERAVNQWPHDHATGVTLLPDVLAIGHTHEAYVGVRHTPRGQVVGVRMGSWQIATRYERQRGFTKYRPTAPVVILHPTKRQMEPHADYRHGLDRLRELRSRKRRQGAA